MMLEKGKWYMRKGAYASPVVWCVTEDHVDHVDDWIEIEPPTIVRKKRDLSQAKVGDKCLQTHQASWLLPVVVLHLGKDFAIVMEDIPDTCYATASSWKIHKDKFKDYVLID